MRGIEFETRTNGDSEKRRKMRKGGKEFEREEHILKGMEQSKTHAVDAVVCANVLLCPGKLLQTTIVDWHSNLGD